MLSGAYKTVQPVICSAVFITEIFQAIKQNAHIFAGVNSCIENRVRTLWIHR